jgi:hypothetical protein
MKTALPNHQRTVAEVAAILRVGPKVILRAIKSGELATKDGVIYDDDLRAFLDSRLTSGPRVD